MHNNTLVLAHYYTLPEVQDVADYVGDSLDLSLAAKNKNSKRIVFAGVRFMAETAKILNPQAEVILPDAGSTCSLVTQTNVADVIKAAKGRVLVSYINSSAELKAASNWIVTSRNVEDIISHIINVNKQPVYFAPDRNMGAYLHWKNPSWGDMFDYYSAVCIVHDKFKEEELERAWREHLDTHKWLIAHPESPLPVLRRADFIGSTTKMLDWVKQYNSGAGIIFVATEEGLLYNMRNARPDLDIRLAPMYTGCQCNSCPFMKLNTKTSLFTALNGEDGLIIDYLNPDVIERARVPIEKMLAFGG